MSSRQSCFHKSMFPHSMRHLNGWCRVSCWPNLISIKNSKTFRCTFRPKMYHVIITCLCVCVCVCVCERVLLQLFINNNQFVQNIPRGALPQLRYGSAVSLPEIRQVNTPASNVVRTFASHIHCFPWSNENEPTGYESKIKKDSRIFTARVYFIAVSRSLGALWGWLGGRSGHVANFSTYLQAH